MNQIPVVDNDTLGGSNSHESVTWHGPTIKTLLRNLVYLLMCRMIPSKNGAITSQMDPSDARYASPR